jgi:hypothetical protein
MHVRDAHATLFDVNQASAQNAQHRLSISAQLRRLVPALAAGCGGALVQGARCGSGAGALAWGKYR